MSIPLVLIRKGLDRELALLQLKGLAKLTKKLRDIGQKEFEKKFQEWIPKENKLLVLLREISRIDRTEPIIVNLGDPKITLDLFGYHPYLFDIDVFTNIFRTHLRQYFERAKKSWN